MSKRDDIRKELLDEIAVFLRESRDEVNTLLDDGAGIEGQFQAGLVYGEDYITLWMIEHLLTWDRA